MERPPKKYVCEKCGYLGDTSEHEGCDYLAWTTGEQPCIDQLERELALLKASPVGAPEGWKLVPVVPTHAILDVMFDAGIDRHDGDLTILYRAILAAAPTPPSTEDRKDAEHEDYFADACRLALELECLLLDCKDTAITAKWWESAHEALEQHRQLIVAMQEDKP